MRKQLPKQARFIQSLLDKYNGRIVQDRVTLRCTVTDCLITPDFSVGRRTVEALHDRGLLSARFLKHHIVYTLNAAGRAYGLN